MAVETVPQGRKYLDPKTVAILSNYRLMSRLIVDGFFMGLHQGPRNAFSLEYNRHREYYPGDPLKLVDWKLFGKTDRFFIKQFEEETNLEAWMVMDISQSMAYTGKKDSISKMNYASYLAAALSYLLINQKDLVGLMLFDEKLRKVIRPSSTDRQLNLILGELQRLKGGSSSQFEDASKLVASRIKRRGLIVLFSDLLAKPENIEKTLKIFLHKGSELIVFHILTHEELKFPFKRFGHFEDMETKHRVLLQPTLLKEEYQKHMQHYLETLKKVCGKLKISYQMLETTSSFDVALRTLLSVRTRMH